MGSGFRSDYSPLLILRGILKVTPMKTTVKLALALLMTTGQLDSVQAIDLPTAWQQAKAYDAQVKAQQALMTVAKERNFQANAANGLNATGTASLFETFTDTNRSAHQAFLAPSLSAQASYPLYRPQNLLAIESSKLQMLLSETQLKQLETDLLMRVAQAYFDILAAEDNLVLLRSQKKAISEQLASAKRNFEVGTATITDQQEAQARFDLTVAQEIAAENELDVRRAALSNLTGQPLAAMKGLSTKAVLAPPSPNDEAAWVKQASESAYPVLLGRVASELAKREVDRASAAHKPTIDAIASASMSRSGSSGVSLISRSLGVGVQLTVPIFNGGGLDSRQREAVAALDKAENDILASQRIAGQSSRSVFKKLSSGLAQIKALQQAEKSSQLALDSNLLGYQVGVRINIDVLNAQQQLFTTQRDLARARYEVLLDYMRLKQAVGSLSEADLNQVAAQLTEARIESRAQ